MSHCDPNMCVGFLRLDLIPFHIQYISQVISLLTLDWIFNRNLFYYHGIICMNLQCCHWHHCMIYSQVNGVTEKLHPKELSAAWANLHIFFHFSIFICLNAFCLWHTLFSASLSPHSYTQIHTCVHGWFIHELCICTHKQVYSIVSSGYQFFCLFVFCLEV